MNQDKRKAEAIASLGEVFKPALSDTAVQLYVAALQDLTADEVLRACACLLTTAKFRPTPSEIREAAGAGGISNSDRATLAFAALEKAIRTVGYYRSPDFDDQLINATVRMLGGWERACEIPSEEFDKWYRKEFDRTYQTLLRTGVDGDATAPLVGYFERTNAVLGYTQSEVKKLAGHDNTARVETGLPWVGQPVKQLPGPKDSPSVPKITFQRP